MMFGLNRYQTPRLSGRPEQARVDAAPVGSVGAPGGALPVPPPKPEGMNPLQIAALLSSPAPLVGDAIGLAADLEMYQRDPESRTLGNYALTGLGAALPFVPGAATIKGAWKAAGKVDFAPVKQFVAGDDAGEYLYHVTTKAGARGIGKEGFRGGSSGGGTFGGGYVGHSKGKVFFTDAEGVEHWKNRIENLYDAEGKKPPSLYVVRVKKDSVPALAKDPAGGVAASSFMVDLSAPDVGKVDPMTGFRYMKVKGSE